MDGSEDRTRSCGLAQCIMGKFCLAKLDKNHSLPKILAKSNTFRCHSSSIFVGKRGYPPKFGASLLNRSPKTSGESTLQWAANLSIFAWSR